MLSTWAHVAFTECVFRILLVMGVWRSGENANSKIKGVKNEN